MLKGNFFKKDNRTFSKKENTFLKPFLKLFLNIYISEFVISFVPHINLGITPRMRSALKVNSNFMSKLKPKI